jgi:hypothetical protein
MIPPRPTPVFISYVGRGVRYAKYRCVCGAEFETRTAYVKRGSNVSCGCYKKAILASRGTHCESSNSATGVTKEYRAWSGMKVRCFNLRSHNYPQYGARGITVCERWLGDGGYANFLSDMGRAPSPKHSVDRINPDGNYEPSNCRWATPREQGNNKRNNSKVTVCGVTKNVSEWARIKGVRAGALRLRIRAGWKPETAILTPVRRKRPNGFPKSL